MVRSALKIGLVLAAFAPGLGASAPGNAWEAMVECAEQLGSWTPKRNEPVQAYQESGRHFVFFAADGRGYEIKSEDIEKHGRFSLRPDRRLISIASKPTESKSGLTRSCVMLEVELNNSPSAGAPKSISSVSVIENGLVFPRLSCEGEADMLAPLLPDAAHAHLKNRIFSAVALMRTPGPIYIDGECTDGVAPSEMPILFLTQDFSSKQALIMRTNQSYFGSMFERCEGMASMVIHDKPQAVICQASTFKAIDKQIADIEKDLKRLIGGGCASPQLPSDLRKTLNATESELSDVLKVAARNRDWLKDYCKSPVPPPLLSPVLPAKAIGTSKTKEVPVPAVSGPASSAAPISGKAK